MFFLVLSNEMILTIIIFLVCIVIGFFGDMYMRKNNKIESVFGVRKKEPKKNNLNNKNLNEEKSVSNGDENVLIEDDNNEISAVQDLSFEGLNLSDFQENNNLDSNINSNITQSVGVNNMTNEINTDSVDAIKESEMVNSPVPFDGVVNGDDQVNNIF